MAAYLKCGLGKDRCGLGIRLRQIRLSLVPRLSQLSCTVKQGEPGIFSHMSMTQSEMFRLNRLYFAYYLADYTLNAWCIRQLPSAS